MFAPESFTAAAMMTALTLYALLGGADFGGGILELFLYGKSGVEGRKLIANAIGPVWEANHVWLILVIVLLFVCFPPAFAAIMTTLFVPLSFLLIGIIFRGTLFVLRSYVIQRQQIISRFFSLTSLVTPFFLGVVIGGVSSGTLNLETKSLADSLSLCLHPYPMALGVLTVILFSFLAAVYLTLETDKKELQDLFRLRGIILLVLLVPVALVVFFLARTGAPRIFLELSGSVWSVPLFLLTFGTTVVTALSLVKRRFRIAQLGAGALTVFILWGWGLAQFPMLLVPDLTIYNTAAPTITHQLVLIALGGGAIVLFPSLYTLFKVFKWDSRG
ncbi:MAG: cytochrome d ubiquinol oxidase subunit II [bacterium]|nr:cytochrome d ubiquinol oxidase subunit II [bacterium]